MLAPSVSLTFADTHFGTPLCSPLSAEQEAIRQEVKALLQEQPEAVKKGAVPALLRGAAAHHAGCLPAWKALIERLFQRGGFGVHFLLARLEHFLVTG